MNKLSLGYVPGVHKNANNGSYGTLAIGYTPGVHKDSSNSSYGSIS